MGPTPLCLSVVSLLYSVSVKITPPQCLGLTPMCLIVVLLWYILSVLIISLFKYINTPSFMCTTHSLSYQTCKHKHTPLCHMYIFSTTKSHDSNIYKNSPNTFVLSLHYNFFSHNRFFPSTYVYFL
jgi:hypothetical protein